MGGPPPEGRAVPTAPEQAWHRLLLKFALAQVLSVLAGLGLGCLVLAAALRRILRRVERDRQSVLRVEVVNGLLPAQVGPVPGQVASDAQAEPAPPPAGHEDAADVPDTAQPFELGPTYEEEQRAREEAERLKEEALLRHLYEQNLRLRDELDQAGDAGAPPEAGQEKAPAPGDGSSDRLFVTYRYDEAGGAGGPESEGAEG